MSRTSAERLIDCARGYALRASFGLAFGALAVLVHLVASDDADAALERISQPLPSLYHELLRTATDTGPMSSSTERSEITLFVDMTCDQSLGLLRDIAELAAEHVGSISLRVRHFPVSDGSARDIALRLQCSSRPWDATPFAKPVQTVSSREFARLEGVFASRMDQSFGAQELLCPSLAEREQALALDLRLGHAAGVVRVPSIIIGDRIVPGRPPYRLLRSILANANDPLEGPES